jgi:hypothetical protein
MKQFQVQSASVQTIQEHNAFVIVLAENPDGTGARIEIQKSLVLDEQDHATGMNTYCLSDDSGACHYGGVVSWELFDACWLRLDLDGPAARALDVQNGFLLNLQIEHEQIAHVRFGMAQILSIN